MVKSDYFMPARDTELASLQLRDHEAASYYRRLALSTLEAPHAKHMEWRLSDKSLVEALSA